ncbi:MAG: transcriptional regulator NanR [Rhizobiales bacterium]|nr:transcriptional regulator NanR [Hyphomicrobiales bacterium]
MDKLPSAITSAGPDRIHRRKLSDEVFDRLKELIASDAHPPGSLMPSERDLMARFGVGRPVVREAMQQLEVLGMVAINHGERARVLEVTPQSLFQRMQDPARLMLARSAQSLENMKCARIFFERGMVREAALKATADEVEHLRAILEEQHSHFGNPPAFIDTDMRFHTAIAAISGNPLFAAWSEAMLGWLKIHHQELLIWTGKEHFALQEHAEVISHIAAHDPDMAEQAMVKHLERTRPLYVPRSN